MKSKEVYHDGHSRDACEEFSRCPQHKMNNDRPIGIVDNQRNVVVSIVFSEDIAYSLVEFLN